MKVPLPLKIGALTLATTAFYTLVGQLVPQKEIYPPKESALKKEMTSDEMVKAGREIMENKGICFTCHTIGKRAPRASRTSRASARARATGCPA